MSLRKFTLSQTRILTCTALGLLPFAPVTAAALHAQMTQMPTDAAKPLPSPAATAQVALGTGDITIKYNTPHMRGRKIVGGLVPYGEVWRTGANPATTIVTSTELHVGTLTLPAGTYTLYTLPAAGQWQLIISKQIGQWGTEYHQDQDFGRVPMMSKPVSSPQEVMSITFENTTPGSTELHVRWESTDEFVKLTTK